MCRLQNLYTSIVPVIRWLVRVSPRCKRILNVWFAQMWPCEVDSRTSRSKKLTVAFRVVSMLSKEPKLCFIPSVISLPSVTVRIFLGKNQQINLPRNERSWSALERRDTKQQLRQLSPGVRVINTRYINSTKGTSSDWPDYHLIQPRR